VTGELLEGPDSLEWGSVVLVLVLVLDLPADDLTKRLFAWDRP
jgi:hypothetical protein